jgi:hypothetical protein
MMPGAMGSASQSSDGGKKGRVVVQESSSMRTYLVTLILKGARYGCS